MLLLTCQGTPNPDWVSSRGTAFYLQDSGWDPAEIQEQEDWFVEGLEGTKYRNPNLQGSQVWVYPYPIECQVPGGLCNGLQIGSVLKVRNMGCPFNSAYTHELMHWLQWQVGVYDYNHIEIGVWRVADSAPRACP